MIVIGPDRKVKAMIAYPMSTGRNFDEVLRLLGSQTLIPCLRIVRLGNQPRAR